MKKWKSVAIWDTCLGFHENMTTDLHETSGQAEAVCRLLEKEGLGGEGRFYPISTRVEPVRIPTCFLGRSMTSADREAMAKCPSGWFKPEMLPPVIRCRDYRCERLEKAGVLKSRVMGESPDGLYREYCLVVSDEQASSD